MPVAVDDGGSLQRVLDAATDLQVVRRRLLEHADGRGLPMAAGTTLIGVGLRGIRRGLIQFSRGCRDHRSTHPTCGITDETFDHDRRFRLSGGRMMSMYNPAGTPEHLTRYLTDEVVSVGTVFAPTPLQMIIFDRSTVVVEGPELGGERTALAVTDRTVLAAAWRYWHSLLPTAVPVIDAIGPDPLARFSPRQREIVHLLADDHTDPVIAARLELSVRTVQYEVAAIMRLLNVRSRFGAGVALGRLGLH